MGKEAQAQAGEQAAKSGSFGASLPNPPTGWSGEMLNPSGQ